MCCSCFHGSHAIVVHGVLHGTKATLDAGRTLVRRLPSIAYADTFAAAIWGASCAFLGREDPGAWTVPAAVVLRGTGIVLDADSDMTTREEPHGREDKDVCDPEFLLLLILFVLIALFGPVA